MMRSVATAREEATPQKVTLAVLNGKKQFLIPFANNHPVRRSGLSDVLGTHEGCVDKATGWTRLIIESLGSRDPLTHISPTVLSCACGLRVELPSNLTSLEDVRSYLAQIQ